MKGYILSYTHITVGKGTLPAFANKFCLVPLMFASRLLLTVATAFTAALLGYTAFEDAVVSWSSLAFAPFIAMAALILAWRGIGADHRKLRNADRLWS